MSENTTPGSPQTEPVWAVVVVTHNKPELAARCLQSLQGAVASSYRVVVVNDRSVSRQAIANMATCVVNDTFHGYGANVNRGVAALPDDWDLLLVLNDDLAFYPGALLRLTETFAAHPRAGVIGPRILGEDGIPQPSSFRFTTLWTEFVNLLILPSPLLQAARSRVGARPAPIIVDNADFVLGAAMAFRRDAFRRCGGFDDGFFLYYEENDICARLAEAGWETLTDGAVQVVHKGHASTADIKYAAVWGRSRQRYVTKHWSRWRRAALKLGDLLALAWDELYVGSVVRVRPAKADRSYRHLASRYAAAGREQAADSLVSRRLGPSA